jgi:hypothetical protein
VPDVVTHICARAGIEEIDVSHLIGAWSGYVVDAPLDARGALEPLMAAFDFAAVESLGAVSFFHRSDIDAAELPLSALAASSIADAFARRGDSAELPIEARVRFIDAERDYLIGAVSARRLDRAEGGVATLDAPLSLDPATDEEIAQTLLADRRAAIEALHIEVGPAHLALEPGDRILLGENLAAFEIARIEDAGVRRLELRRSRASLAARVADAEPNAPPTPAQAPTPALAVLDLPPLIAASTRG